MEAIKTIKSGLFGLTIAAVNPTEVASDRFLPTYVDVDPNAPNPLSIQLRIEERAHSKIPYEKEVSKAPFFDDTPDAPLNPSNKT